MRVWLGEAVADLTNALQVLETCGDPTAESIARDLRRFVEDEDVADPPLECAGMGCGPTSACSPACEQEMCDHQWLDRPESDSRQCLICGVKR